jgi:dephospho-CoA kinase
MNILLTGLMGSGKTLVADRIVSEFGNTKLSMAKWIKSTVASHYHLAEINKSLVINDKPMRSILQEIGMYMRAVDPRWHIDEVINEIKTKKVKNFVIDDIRFKNEIDVIKSHYDCITIKLECTKPRRLERLIVRDMVVPTEAQLSESSELEVNNLDYDYLIENNGNIDDLFDKVSKIIRSIK